MAKPMPYGLPSAPVRRSRVASKRQNAGNDTVSGGTYGSAGGVDPAGYHSVFTSESATPGSESFASAVQAASPRLDCAKATPDAVESITRMLADVCITVRNGRVVVGMRGDSSAGASSAGEQFRKGPEELVDGGDLRRAGDELKRRRVERVRSLVEGGAD